MSWCINGCFSQKYARMKKSLLILSVAAALFASKKTQTTTTAFNYPAMAEAANPATGMVDYNRLYFVKIKL